MGENSKRLLRVFSVLPEAYRHFSEKTWPLFKKGPVKTILLFLLLFVSALVAAWWTNTSIRDVTILRSFLPSKKTFKQSEEIHDPFPFNCSNIDLTKGCSSGTHHHNNTTSSSSASSDEECPHYFRWIHENLRPWKEIGGITRKMVESAKPTANFRLLIVNGTVYVERYSPAFQTRDVFTWWGILQLMRRYPGRLPDLDLMFDCDDQPVIRSDDYKGLFAKAPPPLFRYCADDTTLDIIFPDWSFWGWPEVNVKPWGPLSKQLREANKKVKWSAREPYAHWKGNPYTSQNRQDLMKCNPSHNQEWNARIYAQDWDREAREGFKNSDLANQCTHRYKIYVEGRGWSVSEKYILACDSMALVVKPRYYDFFSRSLMPLQHYWPIKEHDICRSIKFVVDWGNTHQKEAQEIGNAGSRFAEEELKMDYVYDYMFHLLNEYSKLLKYKPTVPEKAVEFCSEIMACPASGLVKHYMEESLEMGPSDTGPCNMPPPFNSTTLQDFLGRKGNYTKYVETWENQNRQH
ncbi:O-glucosyltransferase rumi homolog [Macadamia integrifolia]|uniref:O-glucosyltransferase rumi homolog n=1 Tax=Macadamia integrifolia TaxID=60698 RepID=UPI001C4F7292|nr:O-glucosyltransferase rumi homolog [Macadamia integrifolia]XP_042510435.1 O-glucosyltransferase rumi homolog [Macadamia integrifolia]